MPSVLQDDGPFANSFFDVFFDLTVAHSYTLNGTLDANVDGGSGIALLRLFGPGGFSFAAIDFDTVPVLSSGVLGAGSYHLQVSADLNNGGRPLPGGFMSGTVDFLFDMSLTEITVPEPVSLPLFGLGLAGLGVVRRRRR